MRWVRPIPKIWVGFNPSLMIPQPNTCPFRTGQTFLTLTRFIEILVAFVSPNKFIIKIDLKIYQ